jgi:hypothetical protein
MAPKAQGTEFLWNGWKSSKETVYCRDREGDEGVTNSKVNLKVVAAAGNLIRMLDPLVMFTPLDDLLADDRVLG